MRQPHSGSEELQDLSDSIGVLVDEDEMLSILEQASAAEDTTEFLKAKLEDLTKSDTVEIEDHGHFVEQHEVERQQERRDGQVIMVKSVDGWRIRRTIYGRNEYCGKGVAWQNHPKITAPFDTEESARQVARREVAIHLDRQARVAFPMRRHVMYVPTCQKFPKANTKKVGLTLDFEQAQKLESAKIGLRQTNAEWAPGRPVESNADVIRWFFSKLPSVKNG